MSLPQGINYRSTSGFVTDGANEYPQVATAIDYPTTTPQGNSVGWEVAKLNSIQTRDRNSGNDRRLAGVNFPTGDGIGTVFTYRIDLPSAGNYNIAIAAGDPNYSSPCNWDLYDNVTKLTTLTSGTTSAAQRFKDATNTEYTQATWPGSNTKYAATFASTILRIQNLASAVDVVAHLYVEAGTKRFFLIPN